jgi:hypothetical protein
LHAFLKSYIVHCVTPFIAQLPFRQGMLPNLNTTPACLIIV